VTPYLRPTASIAADALLPSNPADALALAQHLIEGPLMANHSHGLWGYSGPTAAGSELTIQSTGIGGPSAAAVLLELAGHGVRRAIRLGEALPLGESAGRDPFVVGAALCGDGASRTLGDADRALPDPELTRSLLAALGARAREATVLSRDLRDPPAEHAGAHPRAHEALLGDLETAALLAAGERAGVKVAGALVVANGDPEHARERLLELGSAGLAALAA
jgi:purine-nucleoside phosphorylase